MEHIIYTTKAALKFYDENGNTVAIPIDSLTFNSVAVSLENITIPLIVSETESEDLNEDPIDIREFYNT